MAQIKHLIYPERYAGDVELATAIRELQDIQIARSDAAPDQIGPQAAPTPDPERILPSGKDLSEDALLASENALRLAKIALGLSIAAFVINVFAWWMR